MSDNEPEIVSIRPEKKGQDAKHDNAGADP
jgi:hypothetical protein